MDATNNIDSSAREEHSPIPVVVGDVIGSTAYSERFVLRILLKFSEIAADESALEKELCTLWDMTAERDVVEFLLRHNFIELVRFAWPSVPSARTAEILVGVLANMCCYENAVRALRADADFCSTIVQLVHSDDSPVLVQLLRLINACLHGVCAADAATWLELFASNDFPPALAFILSNSAHKELLTTALETLNVVCSTCNIQATRVTFIELFINEATVDGLHGCFEELLAERTEVLERHERERLFLVSLELTMHFCGFDKSSSLYEERKNKVCNMVMTIMEHYVTKIISDKEIDTDFKDVVQSAIHINSILHLHRDCETDKSFELLYRVWKALKDLGNLNCEPSFEDTLTVDEVKYFSNQMNKPLCCYLCKFLESCPVETLKKTLNMMNDDFDDVLRGTEDCSLSESVRTRRHVIATKQV